MSTLADIAAELPGYDPQHLCAADASDFLERLVCPLTAVHTLPLAQCLGRVLARDILATQPVPTHAQASIDGYALHHSVLRSGAWLNERPPAPADTDAATPTPAGPCVYVQAGQAMPEGTDTVVPQELVQRGPHGLLQLTFPLPRPREGCIGVGAEFTPGEMALQKGELLTPSGLALAAFLGLENLPVVRPLRVALLHAAQHPAAQATQAALQALLTRLGVELVCLPATPALCTEPAAALAQAAQHADAVITCGVAPTGTQAPVSPPLPPGAEAVRWQLAIRPAAHLTVGCLPRTTAHPTAEELEEKNGSKPYAASANSYEEDSNMTAAAWSVWLDVPAQPVAAWVCFAMFIRPALLRLMGAYPQATPLLQARSSEILRKKPGHTQYQLGTVFTAPDGNLQVCTTSVQGSDQISSLARANGLIVLRHEQGDVTAGDVVEILMFDTTL